MRKIISAHIISNMQNHPSINTNPLVKLSHPLNHIALKKKTLAISYPRGYNVTSASA